MLSDSYNKTVTHFHFKDLCKPAPDNNASFVDVTEIFPANVQSLLLVGIDPQKEKELSKIVVKSDVRTDLV
ncbi:MAG TPA: hypothetical protein PLT70_07785, partial [bacterium]|nr:hypothetical protein [bacterium]